MLKNETINIQGMTCNHCVMAVRRELAKIETLEVDDVQIGFTVVDYDESAISRADIDSAIQAAGFVPLAPGQTAGGLTQIQT